MLDLTQIKTKLESTNSSEAERLAAYGDLKLYLDQNPLDEEAWTLYTGMRDLATEWTSELVSI